MSQANTQVLFFQHLKTQLPPNISMVDEVADLLGISNDSAYRRIRGEKPIDLEETRMLCSHYKISMDQLLHLQSDAFIFTGILNDYTISNFEKYLGDVQQQLKMINSYEHKHIYFLMKDIPYFYHFQIPELAAFKIFFWMKSILHNENLKGMKFNFNDPVFKGFLDTSQKITELYNQIPVTEIWNAETLNSTLRQIEFYQEAGSFKNTGDVKLLYEKAEQLVNHIERQADLGVKFNINQEPSDNAATFRLFVNDLILGDNTFMAEMDSTRITFLNHSVLYFAATRDVRFNNAMNDNMQNLLKKSTMISTIGEKDRVRFFNRLRTNIHLRLSALK
ncbi:MAG: helix-turn-helix domain-containing protein [Ginsengibacter sp.]